MFTFANFAIGFGNLLDPACLFSMPAGSFKPRWLNFLALRAHPAPPRYPPFAAEAWMEQPAMTAAGLERESVEELVRRMDQLQEDVEALCAAMRARL
jgi:hypothetical protein